MFTGIIQEVGNISQIKELNGGLELGISCSFAGDTHVDESIAVNGVCLTVTGKNDEYFTVQSVDETLRKTTLGSLKKDDPVNLERSLTLQKGIEGHLVQGHVDTTGTIEKIQKEGTDWLFGVRFPKEYRDLIVGRGSITIEGISLTVAREAEDSFTIAIIPYTYEHTNLKQKKQGDAVNLEFDILGKYVIRYLENRAGENPSGKISREWLKDMGY